MPENRLPCSHNRYSVLLAGGTGTRLWPVSRDLYPKQLVNFFGKNSLVQNTIKRLMPVMSKDNIMVVCGEQHAHEIARHMEAIGVASAGRIICEPCGRNTAPAILLAVLQIIKSKKDGIVCIFPADHVIREVDNFHTKVKQALQLADKGHIVTFGILPHYPETGYGYIEGGDEISIDKELSGAFKIKRFVEKPDKKTAAEYIKAGNFFWNSGMFVFKASVIIEEFKSCHPVLYDQMVKIVATDGPVLKDAYARLPDISIDYAVMEKTDKGVVLPSDFGWSDIGSWKSLYDFLPKDGQNNVIAGDVIANDTFNCFIMGRQRLIAANHINNMVVVETPDSVFVSDIDNSSNVKSIVAELKKGKRREYHRHNVVHYTWGSLTILEQKEDYKVGRLKIEAGTIYEINIDRFTSVSLTIVKGAVEISGGRCLNTGESTMISATEPVKLENKSAESVKIIVVQIKNPGPKDQVFYGKIKGQDNGSFVA